MQKKLILLVNLEKNSKQRENFQPLIGFKIHNFQNKFQKIIVFLKIRIKVNQAFLKTIKKKDKN